MSIAAVASDSAKVKSQRFSELDSMRGIGALFVVFNHMFHVFHFHLGFGTSLSSFLIYPFVTGQVMFFFLLSGFVLAMPFLHGKGQPYRIYLTRRILRIYGPYLAALALSVGANAIWHRPGIVPTFRGSIWAQSPDIRSILQHVGLIGNYDFGRYNVSFWSLVYEMRVSTLFPLVFMVTRRLKLIAALSLLMALNLIGSLPGFPVTLEYIAIFMGGILLATHLSAIGEWYKDLSTFMKGMILAGSFVVYSYSHIITDSTLLWHIADLLIVVGSAGFIVTGINSERIRNLLKMRAPAYLGKIAYSLYLVHATVLFGLSYLLKDRTSEGAFYVIFLITSILLSWAFYEAVEAPFTRWSKQFGKRKTTYEPY
jgi:peptidoglycan/LPS O-acetylase OafA/YrhL